jgi:signal transduction histidine kinase
MNAVEASRRGEEVLIRAHSDNQKLSLEVRDYGCGIDDETLPKIFNPFFSTKSSGTGLGLAIAQRIAELHGGKIVVTSVPGQGTNLRMIL